MEDLDVDFGLIKLDVFGLCDFLEEHFLLIVTMKASQSIEPFAYSHTKSRK